MMTQNWRMPQPAALVAINVDAADATKNYRADVVLVADAREATTALAAKFPPRERCWTRLAQRLAELRADVRTASRGAAPRS